MYIEKIAISKHILSSSKSSNLLEKYGNLGMTASYGQITSGLVFENYRLKKVL